MKKSFCDICGENADLTLIRDQEVGNPYKFEHATLSHKITVSVYFSVTNPKDDEGVQSDLCKKCARELLDKIEL